MSKRASAELETSLYLEEAVGLAAGLGGEASEGESGGEVPGELDVGGEVGGAEVGEVVGRESADGRGGQGAVVEDVGEHVGGEEEAGVVDGGAALRHVRRGERRVARSGGRREWAGFMEKGVEVRSTPTPKSRVLRVCALTWQDFPSNCNMPRPGLRFRKKRALKAAFQSSQKSSFNTF